MRPVLCSLTLAAALTSATLAKAESPPADTGNLAAMTALTALGAAGMAGGVAATVASAHEPPSNDENQPGPHETFQLVAGMSYFVGGVAFVGLTALLVERVFDARAERASVAVVPQAGPTGAGATVVGRF